MYVSAYFSMFAAKVIKWLFFIGKVISLISVNLTVFTINNEQSCKKKIQTTYFGINLKLFEEWMNKWMNEASNVFNLGFDEVG